MSLLAPDPPPYVLPFGLFVFRCPFCFDPVDACAPAPPYPYAENRPPDAKQLDIRLRMHQRCVHEMGVERSRAVIAEARRQLVWECRSQLN